MARNVAGIECRPGKRADGVRTAIALIWRKSQRCIVEVRPEYRLCDGKRLRAELRLSPAHHLRIEPGRLHRIRAGCAFPADQQVAVAFAHDSLTGNLETAVQRALDDLAIDADPLRLRENSRCLGAMAGILDEFNRANMRADQGGHYLRIPLRPALPHRQHLL